MLQVEGVTEVGTFVVTHSLALEAAPTASNCLLVTGVQTKGYNLVSSITFFQDTALESTTWGTHISLC
jgi:hypothetical protein